MLETCMNAYLGTKFAHVSSCTNFAHVKKLSPPFPNEWEGFGLLMIRSCHMEDFSILEFTHYMKQSPLKLPTLLSNFSYITYTNLK